MGGQKNVVLFYEALKKYHNVLLAVSKDNRQTGSGFEVKRILFSNKQMIFNLGVLPLLVKLIKQEKIDLVVAEHSYTGWIAWLLKKVTGKSFIIHSHNIESHRFKNLGRSWWRFYQRYESWIHRKAAHSFFISEEDKTFAIKNFKLDRNKCTVIPYGITIPECIPEAKQLLRSKYDLHQKYIFHFNGTLDYYPNTEAVQLIIQHLNPLLLASGLDYIILISGKRLSQKLQDEIYKTAGIFYTGFVDDIDLLYQGCDVFVNAVTKNAGVKTKIIEALANDCTVVSTVSGLGGIPKETYGSKILSVADEDWQTFTSQIIAALENKTKTPSYFFNYFSWSTIAANASKQIESVVRHV
jgi:glycosyltransferase involved in cell wall biosynthesis